MSSHSSRNVTSRRPSSGRVSAPGPGSVVTKSAKTAVIKPMALVPLSLVIADFEGGERPRKAFRQRAITWAMWVAARFARDGLEFEVHPGEAAGAGTEIALHPRAGRSNAGRGRGVSLLLSIDRVEVEVCLELHAATAAAQTLRSIVGLGEAPASLDVPRLEVLMDALARLPEQFEARIGLGPSEAFVSAIDGDLLRGLAERLVPGGEPLRIGWRLPREVALEHAALLDEQLADALLALAPIFRLLGGPRTSSPRTNVAPVRLSRPVRATIPELKARTGIVPTLRVSGRTTTFTRPARIVIPSSIGGLSSARRAHARANEVLIRGTRVRVLSGPFEGKEGVVQELDGKGGARVLLGLLATRLELVDLQPASRAVPGRPLGRGDRPAFGTSHRRS